TREEEEPGIIQIDTETVYDPVSGYGFAETAAPTTNEEMRDFWPGDYFIPSVKTFLIDVPFGNYEVLMSFGRADVSTETTVKAGPGRLVLLDVRTEPGQIIREAYAVHV